MTLVQKAENLIEKAKKATEGPWIFKEEDGIFPVKIGSTKTDEWFAQVLSAPSTRYRDGFCEGNNANKNASFIAAANPETIQEICTALLKYREALEKLEGEQFRTHMGCGVIVDSSVTIIARAALGKE